MCKHMHIRGILVVLGWIFLLLGGSMDCVFVWVCRPQAMMTRHRIAANIRDEILG